MNTDSLVVMNGKAEPVIKEYDVGSRFQFYARDILLLIKTVQKTDCVQSDCRASRYLG